MLLGTVKWWDKKKGYGFIQRDDEKDDVFVHYTGLKEVRNLEEGQKVSFDLTEGLKGKIQATNVVVCQ